MRLAEWIKASGITRTKVAEAIGVSPSYVTNLCSDEPNWPGRDIILKLDTLTDGAVTANDFLPTPVQPVEDAA